MTSHDHQHQHQHQSPREHAVINREGAVTGSGSPQRRFVPCSVEPENSQETQSRRSQTQSAADRSRPSTVLFFFFSPLKWLVGAAGRGDRVVVVGGGVIGTLFSPELTHSLTMTALSKGTSEARKVHKPGTELCGVCLAADSPSSSLALFNSPGLFLLPGIHLTQKQPRRQLLSEKTAHFLCRAFLFLFFF